MSAGDTGPPAYAAMRSQSSGARLRAISSPRIVDRGSSSARRTSTTRFDQQDHRAVDEDEGLHTG